MLPAINEIHALKCWPEYFAALKSGKKPWEFRKNDRDYKVGDVLMIRCWDPTKKTWIDDEILMFKVVYLLKTDDLGMPGYVVMSIARVDRPDGTTRSPF